MKGLIDSDRQLIEAKKRIEPFVQTYDRWDREVLTYVESLTDEELAVVSAEANLFGQTNCGWDEYRVAHHIGAEARQELRSRAYRAQSA